MGWDSGIEVNLCFHPRAHVVLSSRVLCQCDTPKKGIMTEPPASGLVEGGSREFVGRRPMFGMLAKC